MAAVQTLLLLLFASLSASYKHYQDAIPNGDRVNHPCLPNKVWQGVGHKQKSGGGSRNPFGKDFVSAGHKWTQALCQKDSDGDGRSNGAELGDPGCVWIKGSAASRTKNITHPGVCEPITSPHCKTLNGAWDLCKSDKLNCPGINATGVTNFTLRFTRSKVPSKVTNYYCQAFHLPNDTDYHMIADEPLIDNAEVMHHAIVYGCRSKPDAALFRVSVKRN